MITSILSSNLLWTEAREILLVLFVVSVIAFFMYRPLLFFTGALFLFSFYFFRNPVRQCEQAFCDNSVLICPADGKVVDVQYDQHGGIEGYHQKVSIFLSPFDVHVNWAPTGGTVQDVVYRPGTFTMAFLPKSSLLNERNDVIVAASCGQSYLVRQIAGTIARRICCWVEKGTVVKQGQKFGMIRFGSRVDVLLPAGVELAVGLGQRVYGGQTILGRWVCH